MKIDEIKELIKLFGKSKLDKLQIKQKDFELEMQKGNKAAATSAPAAQPVVELPTKTVAATAEQQSPSESESQKKIDGEIITSPMVGTLYSSPSPDSPPFVKVGDKVKRGDVLCILEAMKIMNELEAEYDCKILDILVGNGEAVEYGKPLFVVERI
jgi:acetyl-CoA carboxylase biotin carboxyl carrier protein